MKKKLEDLTSGEMKTICKKHKKCNECPLFLRYFGKVFCPKDTYAWKDIGHARLLEYGEREIEV